MAQNEEPDEDRDKKEKERLHNFGPSSWLATKRVYAFAPSLNNGQWNCESEDSQMQQNRFQSQFVHGPSEKAGDKNVDTGNKPRPSSNREDFSHELFDSALRFTACLCLSLVEFPQHIQTSPLAPA